MFIYRFDKDREEFLIGFFTPDNVFIETESCIDQDYAIEMVSFLNGGIINPSYKKKQLSSSKD